MRKITKLNQTAPAPVKRKKVAAYARLSSGKDAQLHSLSVQISYYNNYIGNRGDWELAGIYADEALTGTKEGRPEFQRLLTDCRNGKIDMVITKSVTRLARNTLTLLETARELKSLGIDIYFEKENIHTMSMDGELMLTLLASFAQEESRSASENCKWRIRKMFKQGRATNGNALGYRFVDGNFRIVPEEAEIVRQIFNDFLSGMGINAIVKKLNRSGIPAKNGGLWSEATISNIIHNEKYTGDLLLQKYYHLDHISKKTVKNRGELPQYLVENNHDPIISKEAFKQVQKELELRMAKFGITREPPKTNLFTGIIRCTMCGKNFRHKIANAGQKCEKPVWCCSTFNTRGKNFCPSQQIPENILISKILAVLNVTELDREMLLQYIKEIQVPAHNQLIYVLTDGRIIEVPWHHPSRKESWTESMKQDARDRQLQFRERVNKNGKNS